MNFEFFGTNGFEFQNLLKVQGLEGFVQLDTTFFPYLLKAFVALIRLGVKEKSRINFTNVMGANI
ncbi:hypothetical protein CR513_31208, partial [Mucuna pruriens]